MREGTIRAEQGRGWTTVYNDVARDTRLSLKARGLFLLMWSLPPDWRYTVSGLASVAGCGRDAVKGALRELEAAGYLTREQSHAGNGTFGGTCWVLRQEADTSAPSAEDPLTDIPLTDIPLTADPSTEDPTVQKKDRQKKDRLTPPYPPGGGTGADRSDEIFERFWRAYPRREKKQAAVKAWKKLSPDLDLCRTMAAALERQKRSDQWVRDGGRYIPLPASWLNGRRWEDEIPDAPPLSGGPSGGPATVPDDGGWWV